MIHVAFDYRRHRHAVRIDPDTPTADLRSAIRSIPLTKVNPIEAEAAGVISAELVRRNLLREEHQDEGK